VRLHFLETVSCFLRHVPCSLKYFSFYCNGFLPWVVAPFVRQMWLLRNLPFVGMPPFLGSCRVLREVSLLRHLTFVEIISLFRQLSAFRDRYVLRHFSFVATLSSRSRGSYQFSGVCILLEPRDCSSIELPLFVEVCFISRDFTCILSLLRPSVAWGRPICLFLEKVASSVR
jgi:hypothetical protein